MAKKCVTGIMTKKCLPAYSYMRDSAGVDGVSFPPTQQRGRKRKGKGHAAQTQQRGRQRQGPTTEAPPIPHEGSRSPTHTKSNGLQKLRAWNHS